MFTNALIKETSPYLLQHAHNPVDWLPWGKDVLLRAQKEDKLLIISIGYSACHWCHVMEAECFNDEEVALVMNESFLSIKVDKEEHPEVDQQYMAAVRIINGNGGWPLNIIALPDGRPVYGGSYFSRTQWMSVLGQMQNLYSTSKDYLIKAADDLAEGVSAIDIVNEKSSCLGYLPKYLRVIVESWKRKFDKEWGGTLSTPKFPLPVSIDFLLSYAYHMRDAEVKEQALLTLQKMSDGGVFDHVGGGFHRYSVDNRWFLPHFEKMLYDNVQLSLSYAYGYQSSKNEHYKKVAVETLEFLIRDLQAHNGMFYSSVDADSDEGEGVYYLWSYNEIASILDEDTLLFCARFGIVPKGNLENGLNILSVDKSIKELSIIFSKTEKEVEDIVNLSLRKLFCGRFLREKPRVDTKLILSWNALAVKSFAISSTIFNEPRYLVVAIDCIKKIEDNFWINNTLFRTEGDVNQRIHAVFEDYAYLVEAYIALYSVTFDYDYIRKAEELVNVAFEKFYDYKSGMFFFTSSDVILPLGRKMDMVDGVMPSSNSSFARSLYYLSIASSNFEYKNIAIQMLANVRSQMSGAGPFIANWGMLLINLTFAPAEVTIVGENALKEKHLLDKDYLPNVLFFGSKQSSELPIFKNRWKQGETTIYLCLDNMCRTFDGDIYDLKENALEVRNCYIL